MFISQTYPSILFFLFVLILSFGVGLLLKMIHPLLVFIMPIFFFGVAVYFYILIQFSDPGLGGIPMIFIIIISGIIGIITLLSAILLYLKKS